MSEIFIKLLNMSISAGWLVLCVVILRLLLKKSPKWIACVLWSMVALRLLCPFSIESVMSLVPSAETVPEEIIYSPVPEIESGIPVINSTINPIISEGLAPAPKAEVNPMEIITGIASVVWLVGVAAMAVYACVSYIRIRKRISEAISEGDGVWICDRIDTPFIIGLFAPRIVLPSDLKGEDREYVISHEKAHLSRMDHIWKPLGFALLTVYWFNPLIWIGYILLCRDIEAACDEKVIRKLGEGAKRSYAEALINCSVPKRMISACPLAFGESGVKERVKNVLNYKKPAFWVIIVAIVACIVVALCFLTNPKEEKKPDKDDNAVVDTTDDETTAETTTDAETTDDKKALDETTGPVGDGEETTGLPEDTTGVPEETTGKPIETTPPSGTEDTTGKQNNKPVVKNPDTTVSEPVTTLKAPTDQLLGRIESDYYAYNKKSNKYADFYNVERYYGEYNGSVAIMFRMPMPGWLVVREVTVAESDFRYSTPADITVWKNGSFYTLEEAYKQGVLTKKEIAAIAEIHKTGKYLNFDRYNETEDDTDKNKWNPEPPAEGLLVQISKDFCEYQAVKNNYDPEIHGSFYVSKYYGTYNNSVPVLIVGNGMSYAAVITTETVAGYTFTYPSSNTMWVWNNGSFYSLQEAYDKGLLTKEDIAEIFAVKPIEYDVMEYGYPN